MATGVAIVGLNGSGKSTLAHAFAGSAGYFEMDVEDYYFPTQREDRRRALEGLASAAMESTPFADAQSHDQVEAALLADIREHPRFVLSGVHLDWSEEILSRIGLVFWIRTPTEIRLARIRDREVRRFGSRVLPGGDMFAEQERFHGMAAARTEALVEACLRGIRCPVVMLDGVDSVETNLRRMRDVLKI